jgi:hypothetical protein
MNSLENIPKCLAKNLTFSEFSSHILLFLWLQSCDKEHHGGEKAVKQGYSLHSGQEAERKIKRDWGHGVHRCGAPLNYFLQLDP